MTRSGAATDLVIARVTLLTASDPPAVSRLPPGLTPAGQTLSLIVPLGYSPAADIMEGTFELNVDVAAEASGAVVLNAHLITMDEASLSIAPAEVTAIGYDYGREQVWLFYEEADTEQRWVVSGGFQVPLYPVEFEYGFFQRMYLDEDDEEEHLLATTQFETTGAR